MSILTLINKYHLYSWNNFNSCNLLGRNLTTFITRKFHLYARSHFNYYSSSWISHHLPKTITREFVEIYCFVALKENIHVFCTGFYFLCKYGQNSISSRPFVQIRTVFFYSISLLYLFTFYTSKDISTARSVYFVFVCTYTIFHVRDFIRVILIISCK